MKLIRQITTFFGAFRSRGLKRRLFHPMLLTPIVFCNFALAVADSKLPQTRQSLPAIEQAAKIFLEEKQVAADNASRETILADREIKIGTIDPRTRLKPCDGELKAFLPQQYKASGKMTVGVHCTGSVAWKVFLPASIERFMDVWVTSRSISPQEIITRQDVELQRVRFSNARRQPLENIELIENTSPRKRLSAGSVIYQDALCMVCRGDKVSVNAQSSFMSIMVEGVALSDAIMGETTQVRNSKSKRVFAAIVTGKNQLSVNLSRSR